LEQLPPLTNNLFKAADAIDSIHYARFVALSEKTMLFLADFDGEFETLLRDLARHLGPMLDTIFEHVDNPPPLPLANNFEVFAAWAAGHHIDPIMSYSAYPGGTVHKIRSLAPDSGVSANAGLSEQFAFLMILPIKAHVFTITELLVHGAAGRLIAAMDDIGTVHFAHLVGLENNQLGFFTVYDGPCEEYVQGFAEKLGPIFDILCKFAIDPPPMPAARNVDALTRWVAAHNVTPIGFYAAYPGLRVHEVNALLGETLVARG